MNFRRQQTDKIAHPWSYCYWVAAAIFSLFVGAQLVWAEVEPSHQQESLTVSLNEENHLFEPNNALKISPSIDSELRDRKLTTRNPQLATRNSDVGTILGEISPSPSAKDKLLFLLKDVINWVKKALFGHEGAKGPVVQHLFIIKILMFAVVGLVIYAVFSLLPGKANPIKDRLEQLRFAASTHSPKKALSQAKRKDAYFLRERLYALGQLIIPRSEKARAKMRMEMSRAGYRRSDAVSIYSGIKVLFALIFMSSFVVAGLAMKMKPGMLALFSIAVAGLGMYLPILRVRFKIKRRKATILSGFPDTLDLLAVCVDAGLGMDAAIVRVSNEIRLINKPLSEELQLVNLEMRAGKPRTEAWHNLGQRTDVEDIQALVAMLIQTDKFGTSIAQSLRVHSDAARTKRRLKAEEAAAKTAVKMVFPLVLFILPALFVVVMGPAVLQIVRTLGSK